MFWLSRRKNAPMHRQLHFILRNISITFPISRFILPVTSRQELYLHSHFSVPIM